MIEVVGIGAQGWQSLGPSERNLVTSACRIFGSRRHLNAVPDFVTAAKTAWPSPMMPALPDLLAGHEEISTVVLASGDPLLAGIGTTLIDLFGPDAVRVYPAVSSVALARARMGWAADTVEVVRLIEPAADVLRRHLSPGRRLIVLSRDAGGPAAVAQVLLDQGFGMSPLSVLSDLGTDQESRMDLTAQDAALMTAPDLNLVCVTCRPVRASALWSCGPGLPDDAYEHDGQLTKRDVRASALAHLMPVAGQLLWDVGAGAGSVAIEWLRSHPTCRAVAVEQEPTRVKRIASNAARLGVPDLTVVYGSAPAALADLPQPDAVFVGGGATSETVGLSWRALADGGRLVVHAVTVQTEAVLLEAWRAYGGELTRITVEHLEPIGGYEGWKPARAVVQWSVQKPLGEE